MPSTLFQEGQADLSRPPSFLRVASPNPPTSSFGSGDIHPVSGFAGAQAPPLPSLPKNLGALASESWLLDPQQWLSLPSTQAVSVMGGLSPVPGYLANMVEKQEFVDFILLRICNIARLPTISPSSAQLERLLKILEPIRAFADWAEAWGVFASVVVKFAPHRLPALLAYFLIIAKAHRDVPGMGWLAYDLAFRKQAANDSLISWAVVDPTLYLSTVLTAGIQQAPQARTAPAIRARKGFCTSSNKSSCSYGNTCRYLHACSSCEGNHQVRECPLRKDPTGRVDLKRQRSPSPLPTVITPLRVYVWREFLLHSLHPDAQWVLQGITFGFDIGVTGGNPASAGRNCVSATRQSAVIDAYLTEELIAGTMAGPFSSPPWPSLITNRFGVIPKSTPRKWRLITDLSFPAHKSVNDSIPDCNTTVSYAGIPEAISQIMKLGKGTLLAKFDIKRAYRLLPVRPEDRPLLGMCWEGLYFVDLALPFSLRSAPRIFTRFGDVLQSIFAQDGHRAIIQHYLDDFIIFGQRDSSDCAALLKHCTALCDRLGVPLAEDKTEGPSTEIVFLGFILDTEALELPLPIEKIVKIQGYLAHWSKTAAGTKRELLSLIGSLQHCCQAIVLGRPFLRRLIDRAHKVSELHHRVRLSAWERDDIDWWVSLLSCWNGRSLFLYRNWTEAPTIKVTSDAAGSKGFAAIYNAQWFAAPWPADLSAINIAIKELIPIVLAAKLWGESWQRMRVAFRCDNMAVVHCLQNGTAKDRHLAFLLRELSILAITQHFTFTAIHLPGRKNQAADALSCFDFQTFVRLVPDADRLPLEIPAEFLGRLLFPPWTRAGNTS
eukprot:gene1375-biopygen1124